MRNLEVLEFGQMVKGTQKSRFRSALDNVKVLEVSLAIIVNDKRLKQAAENVNEALRQKEPKELKDLREKLTKAKDEEQKELIAEWNKKYNDFWASDDVQEFLKAENAELELKQVTLDDKQVKRLAVDDPDAVEALMLFTNIEELYTEPATKPANKKPKAKKN